MEDDIRGLGEEAGRKVIARDWAGVHQLLAVWLQRDLSVDDVAHFFEDEYKRLLAEYEIEGMHYPAHPDPEIDGNNFMTAASLREPIAFAGGKLRNVAPEISDDLIRYWMKLQLMCSDEQMETLGFDMFCETWMLIVETGKGLRIGYWSQGAY